MSIYQNFRQKDFKSLKFADLLEPDDEEKSLFEINEKLSFKDWMEQHRVLPVSYSSHPGPWSHDRAPYLTGLMDILDSAHVNHFVMQASSQIAKSELCQSYIMYRSHQKPGPALVIMADEKTSNHIAIDRFKASFEASPALNKIFISGSKNTLVTTNNIIDFGWSSSPAGLASKSKRDILLDEVSLYRTPANETKPVVSAMQRTKAFSDKKILIVSTPNIPGSEIDVQLKSCHERYDFYIPCPHCGEYQRLKFSVQKTMDTKGEKVDSGSIFWKGGIEADPVDISEAMYKCGYCKQFITTRQKNLCLNDGIWHTNDKTYGIHSSKIGAHINRLYSRFNGGKFSEIVKEFIEAKKDGSLKAMQGFVNNVLGENFEHVVQQPKQINLVSKQTKNAAAMVPAGAVCLTCGVDNQKAGKYYTVYAWNKKLRGWLIDYGYINTWKELDEIITYKQYPFENEPSKKMTVWKTAIDTGGTSDDQGDSMTFDVYNYVRTAKAGVYAIKGKSMDDTIIVIKKHIEKTARGDKTIPGAGLFLYRVNTQALLEQFYYQVGQGNDSESCITFHAGMSEDFLKHLLAFKKVRKQDGVFKWEAQKTRVDWVHASLYSMVLAHPQFDGGVSVLTGPINLVKTEGPIIQKKHNVSVIQKKGMVVNPAFRRQ